MIPAGLVHLVGATQEKRTQPAGVSRAEGDCRLPELDERFRLDFAVTEKLQGHWIDLLQDYEIVRSPG
jgi:hypothetical protein